MHRDMNLARSILMKVEGTAYDGLSRPIEVDGATEEEVSYHIKLLAQGGLLEAQELRSGTRPPSWEPIALTWSGHEFLEAAKDDARWKKAMTTVTTRGGALVFEVLKTLLVEQFRAVVMLP